MDTPLHEAARGGHESTTKVLISNGSDVNSKNKDVSNLHDYMKVTGLHVIQNKDENICQNFYELKCIVGTCINGAFI